MEEYYRQFGGVVLSATIDKFIYIIIKRRYDDKIILNYADRENVDSPDEIQHPIFREALKISETDRGLEITSIADIPAEGSGLGSSSSFTVGLLNALFAFKGEFKNPCELAEMACDIEIKRLHEPIGKQDQYAAAFGGLKLYRFMPDGSVKIKSIHCPPVSYHILNSHSMLFYTGITRKSSSVLTDQKARTKNNIASLNRIKELALQGERCFSPLDLQGLGKLLDLGWQEKKTLSPRIHNSEIDNIYELAKKAGIYGGKLLGAGGGGFFLFICPPLRQNEVRRVLISYRELPFSFEPYGSRILLHIKDNEGFISRSQI
jgi:D-glycero-alpha-D-manno-heptose-7-phosphate kinase